MTIINMTQHAATPEQAAQEPLVGQFFLSCPDSAFDAALLDRAWGRARMADFDIRKLEEL